MSAPDHDWFPTHLRVTVIRARGLRPKGKNGLNKCYTVIQLGEEKFVTSVKEGTLNPEWKEQCSLQLPLVLDSSDKWVLHLVVKQSNAVTPDKFLGHVFSLCFLFDRWYSLISKPNKAVKNRGQLQLTFQFLRDNMTASSYELSKFCERGKVHHLAF
uniref:C2 domain-containing protein n=1 Tax=Callorhinchus milii TaxID=7868 RepID=A0A4W3ITJ1_CALMI